ncbi:MAG: dienelactone hydrolase family protein [Acidobacteriota bacterium]|nr:dienelactone hydrolase family protein [Acidobacteriota bacterium]
MHERAIHIDDAHRFLFEEGGISHPVYRDGSGPGILILHELPGMSDACIRLADLVLREGYTVYLPLFFGSPGQSSGLRGLASVLCLRREFHLFATDRSSPISGWLVALCRRIKEECGGKGVGAIGMCLTGGIVLSLLVDDTVLAPVVSQPALPLLLEVPWAPPLAERKAALGLSPADLAAAVERSATVPVLGYRFATDKICPRERFATLEKAFGPGFRGTEIPTGPENPGGIPDGAHSVFTGEFVNEPGHPTRRALDEVLAHFRRQL